MPFYINNKAKIRAAVTHPVAAPELSVGEAGLDGNSMNLRQETVVFLVNALIKSYLIIFFT
jgi:hypothetical protein